MSEPTEPTSSGDAAGSSTRPPARRRSTGRRIDNVGAAARSHGRVFVLGGLAMGASVLMAAGLTWAGPDQVAPAAAAPSVTVGAAAAAAPSAPLPGPAAPAPVPAATVAPAGSCTLIVDGVARSVDVDRARTSTMIAAVGQHVRAPDAQTARALDVALTEQAMYLPKVTDALGLLARDDTAQPSAESLAEIRALHRPGALHCALPVTGADRDKKLDNGLRPRAEELRSNAVDAFGELSIKGYGKSADKADPASVDGRALAVRFTPVIETNQARGWTFAHWLVARAKAYTVDTVSYAERRWSAANGWTTAPAADARPDAVYVAVVKGTP